MKASKLFWRYARTFLFVGIGLNYTLFLNPAEIGTWKNVLGYIFLVLALIDVILLVKYLINKRRLKRQ